MKGPDVSARLDDTLTVEANDVLHGPARVGLMTSARNLVAFDDLEVRERMKNEKEPASLRY